MKRIHRSKLAVCAALFSGVLLTGCDKKDANNVTTTRDRDSGSSQTTKPVEAARDDLPIKQFVVKGNDLMKFDIEKLEVQARQRVELTLENTGTMPKESMGHNWCLLVKGTDVMAFLEPGFASAGNDYVAPEMEERVIARTKIIGPKESETISFTAPSVPGAYEYICTFPGHFSAGMKGVLEVQE